MDIKEFREGVLSLSCVILILSLGILMGSYFARPYLTLDQFEINFIGVLSICNIVFSLFYMWKAQRSKFVIRLEMEYIIRYAQILSVSILIYIPHTFFLGFLLFRFIALIEKLLIFALLLFEILLIYTIIDFVYNIIWVDEDKRKANIEKNRRK
jgi:hypothetical protein